ncbi:hypothetical protein NQ318_002213 [Aromia moschata]|uniref:Tudor domain-containing protein n=1 Tax=Aromia moschata TaxID=1265417 RepID=A0AAV8Z4J4_9CUCU|nr:hypothetical protein NQ318_002213 [Aromia moschata]
MAIPKNNIYQLKREFALSQAQAFVCRLVGLEELNDPVVDHRVSFTGDKERNHYRGVRLNVEDNGDVYVQLRSHGFVSLQNMLFNLESQILANPPVNLVSTVTKSSSENKIYFSKYKVDGHWYRVTIIDWSPKEDLAQIYFVDYGNTDVINVNEDVLYPLDKLSEVLSQYPYQAIKVRMLLDNIPSDFVTVANKAMPCDQPVLLKIMDYDSEKVPWVEFFKRNADGGLFCINKSITMEAEMKKGDGTNSAKSSKRKLAHIDGAANNVPSGGTLQRPPLPDKGDYFKVHIPFAVNPYNFFVQPLASRPQLNKMMEQLQHQYKNVLYSPLSVEQIVPGNIYA